VIGPLVCADRNRMAAPIVRAIDQDAAHASGAHLCEVILIGRVRAAMRHFESSSSALKSAPRAHIGPYSVDDGPQRNSLVKLNGRVLS